MSRTTSRKCFKSPDLYDKSLITDASSTRKGKCILQPIVKISSESVPNTLGDVSGCALRAQIHLSPCVCTPFYSLRGKNFDSHCLGATNVVLT